MPDTDAGESGAAQIAHVLAQARQAGFLGPGPIERQLLHAEGFARLVRARVSAGPKNPRVADLGSGGGVPGLVVALAIPEAHLALIDANRRRTEFLLRAVSSLGLEDRVTVLNGRAEEIGRDPKERAGYDGVVARSFGPPATVAECAAPLLRKGGWVIVSEPPDEQGPTGTSHADRWPPEGLQELGLAPVEVITEEFGYQVLRMVAPCPERFPRRNGVPAKRPLF